MRVKLIIILYTAGLYSCVETNMSPQAVNVFQIPIVNNSSVPDSIKDYINDSLLMSRIFIMGPFKFTDTLDLSNLPESVNNDSLADESLNGAYDWIENDSYVNGFEMYLDYSQAVYYSETQSSLLRYYPVFFVNSTPSIKVFTGKNGGAVGIQQASFGVENWRRFTRKIKPFIGCGNNHLSVKVNPGEFLLLLVRKYSGDFRPNVRLAIKNGQSIYVSKSFIGNINESQYKYLDSLSTSEFDEDLEIFQF